MVVIIRHRSISYVKQRPYSGDLWTAIYVRPPVVEQFKLIMYRRYYETLRIRVIEYFVVVFIRLKIRAFRIPPYAFVFFPPTGSNYLYTLSLICLNLPSPLSPSSRRSRSFGRRVIFISASIIAYRLLPRKTIIITPSKYVFPPPSPSVK